ncbi:hypothetical protein [Nocardioides sp. REDSEA-S30_B4]|jgi:hypothetical protein|uniref:hypothetical protein n=1 Tax=Nocardioides sp. REDSEA-S30_B4 TaxID=1811552 RepID=UPI000AE093CA|nr:hypothetical protein [Nocardioides sp. REDSEA-S30_B4]
MSQQQETEDGWSPLDVRELDRIAEAVASADGEDFNEYTAPRYRSLARAAVHAASACISDRMTNLPQGGRHTRAGWTVAVLDNIGDAEVDADDPVLPPAAPHHHAAGVACFPACPGWSTPAPDGRGYTPATPSS